VSFGYVQPSNWHPFAPNGFPGVATGAAIVFFAYIGFDAISTTAEETRDPERNMPIGIIGSLVVCTVIYIAVAAVFTGMIGYDDRKRTLTSEQAEPLTLAMNTRQHAHLDGECGGVRLGGGPHGGAACISTRSAPDLLRHGPRRPTPPDLRQGAPSLRHPHITTIVTGLVVAVTSSFTSLDAMVDLTNIGTLFAFILVCIGITILRVKDPGRARPFRVPLGPYVVPVLGIVSCMGLIYYLPPSSWSRFFYYLVAGGFIYISYRYHHSRLRQGRHASTPPRARRSAEPSGI
jgi:APA family basic amino acid/polyamine antiporter